MPSVALVFAFYALLRGVRSSMWRVALLTLPGTFAHELAHFVVGFLVRAKPHGFSVWPRSHGHAWMLGAVSFRDIGLLNGAWVALAPLLLLPIAWLSLIHGLVPLWIVGRWGWWLLAGYQPSVTLNLARQQSDFGMVVDPLPFIPCHPENSPNRREIAIHCRRFDSPAQQPLADLPNHVPINIGQTLLPKNWVKDSTNTLYISDASKRGFYFEIPHYGFLP